SSLQTRSSQMLAFSPDNKTITGGLIILQMMDLFALPLRSAHRACKDTPDPVPLREKRIERWIWQPLSLLSKVLAIPGPRSVLRTFRQWPGTRHSLRFSGDKEACCAGRARGCSAKWTSKQNIVSGYASALARAMRRSPDSVCR